MMGADEQCMASKADRRRRKEERFAEALEQSTPTTTWMTGPIGGRETGDCEGPTGHENGTKGDRKRKTGEEGRRRRRVNEGGRRR